jgi:PAS domain S-box-containing protein
LPLTFILGGLIYALTIFRFKFLELIPTARGKLVENMEDGILVLNSEGGIADLNPATEKIIGANRLEILGKRLDSVWPKLDLIKTNLNRGQHAEMAEDKGGRAQYLDISIIDLKGDEEKLEGELVVIRDMTERRKIEQALRESESRYATLIEQSNEGVLIIQDGGYKFANRTMTEISGYPVNELVGKTIPFGMAEEDRRIIQERYNLRLSGQTVPQFYEIRLVRKDGEKRDIEISIGSITYEGHSADMVTVRDVTERKSTQKKLELSLNAERSLSNSLREEMEKRSKYTRALVHELRTPLTSIMISGELLEEEVKDHLFMELIKNIRRSSFKLQQRINELLELARGEIGMLKINAGPLDMEKLLREAVSEMSPIAASKGLTIMLKITNLPLVMGDKTRLSEVMSNLLSNAIKFTSNGVVTVTAAGDGNGEVLVSVKDTGRGVDRERIKNLFDPYLRKESYEGQDLGGLGIGLALCKLFVELHGGKIWVESQPGSGTVFSFTIPIYRNSVVDGGDPEKSQGISSGNSFL